MPTKLRWGVLSTAAIGLKKVIPAMQLGELTHVTAIASRDRSKAEEPARTLGIEKIYGSYEELLADPQIDVIYNPLPNHLHVPWTIKAAEAGKHVLCEKPLSLTVAEARTLLDVQASTGVKIGEAFMVRTHPQWLRTRELIASGRIGALRSIQGFFSYTNVNPANIRNIPEYGGGGLMDIGCYPINISRFLFGEEPTNVMGLIDRDPEMKTDRLTSAILHFPSGQSIFTCSTQLVPYQRVNIFGTKGRIEVEIPFNAPNDRPTRIVIDDGRDPFGGGISTETFPTCDQYTIQGDAFSKAILEDTAVPVPLEDAIKNMAVIEAIFRSGVSGKSEVPSTL
jgi:predicted dehydrogenase